MCGFAKSSLELFFSTISPLYIIITSSDNFLSKGRLCATQIMVISDSFSDQGKDLRNSPAIHNPAQRKVDLKIKNSGFTARILANAARCCSPPLNS